ncbi:helix-turn-helix domain-containing protein [Candidatus Roizmanbacteria bacterium]|nr:helix-turn-helix domain-containing protein [Candidatus Roizmanbacteria bacterium]
MNIHNNIDLLTPKQVAKILQLNIITIYSYIKNKKLTAIKLGRAYRITKEDLNSFLKIHKTSL